MNSKDQTTYRSIFKAASLFGGVQLWKILIEIVKQKFIAILLGPTGIGISGLYTSATSLIQGLTSMGLSSSAVKNVAEANGTGDFQTISRVVTVIRRLVWMTGLLAMIAVIALSPFLSKTTFGNYDYTIPFIFLSVSLLLQQLSAGQSVILQGLRKLEYLAKSSVLGSFFGLVISIPIYYFFGLQGIVPTLILNAGATLALTWYFSKKIKIESQTITTKQTLQEGKGMLKMGLVMSLNNILVVGVAYIVRIFIAKDGNTEEVGLYTAGFAIVTTYVSLIFTSLGTDFYPRLAAINTDNNKCRELVNNQSEINVLLLSPMLIIFILFAPLIVKILYSSEFTPITTFMQLAMLGIVFQALSWSISYQFMAKADMKIFAINETIKNIISLILSITGYSIGGLDGLGVAFTVSYVLYFFQVLFVAKYRYDFYFRRKSLLLFVINYLFLLVVFCSVFFINSDYKYIVTLLLLVVSSFYTFKELNERMNIREMIRNRFSNPE